MKQELCSAEGFNPRRRINLGSTILGLVEGTSRRPRSMLGNPNIDLSFFLLFTVFDYILTVSIGNLVN